MKRNMKILWFCLMAALLLTASGISEAEILKDKTGTPATVQVANGFAGFFAAHNSTVMSDPDPESSQQPLAVLLSALNAALAPHSVAPLSTIPATVGTPITQALPSNVAFAKKGTPIPAYPGYGTPVPSFSASLVLGSGTTGDVLALSYAIDVSALPGFGGWKTLTDDGKVALLNAQNISFTYEYEGSMWKGLLGAGTLLPWAEALGAGVVEFTDKGLVLNYAVVDGVGSDGEPYASGGVLVIFDLAEDGKIVDPVWLMQKTADRKDDDSSGGCDAAGPGVPVLAAMWLLTAVLRKR